VTSFPRFHPLNCNMNRLLKHMRDALAAVLKRGRFAHIAIFGTCLGAVVAFYSLGHAARSKATLQVEREALDFGEVWVQESFRWTVPIRNTSDRPVHLSEVRASCGCTSVQPSNVSIPAGGQLPLTVQLDLTARTPAEARAETRPFSVALTPVLDADAGAADKGWTLQGRVRTPLAVEPHTLRFTGSNSIIRGTQGRTQVVEIRPLVPVLSLTARCDESLARVSVERDESRGLYLASITPSPALAPSFYQFRVMIVPHTRANDLRPVPIAVSAAVVHDVEVIPPEIMFGPGPLGTHLHQTVALASRTGSGFTIEGIDPLGDDVSIEPAVDESIAASHTFRVSQLLRSPGLHVGKAVFTVRTASSEVVELPLDIRYYGHPSGPAGESDKTPQAVEDRK